MINLRQIAKNEQAIEMMSNKHGDKSIQLCNSCSEKVSGLSVSEDTDTYEVEEIE